MRFVSGLRPSPAIVVACLSLAASLSGVAYGTSFKNSRHRLSIRCDAREKDP